MPGCLFAADAKDEGGFIDEEGVGRDGGRVKPGAPDDEVFSGLPGGGVACADVRSIFPQGCDGRRGGEEDGGAVEQGGIEFLDGVRVEDAGAVLCGGFVEGGMPRESVAVLTTACPR